MATHYFISPRYRQNTGLVLFAFALAFVVIVLGAYTRLTDAGLSCPDWPHCYGYLTAPHTDAQLENAAKTYPLAPVDIKKAWTEMAHRYLAGTEGLLIIALGFGMLFARKAKDLKVKCLGIALLALLVVQVMLGMLTVTEKLKPIIVLSHLLTGISLLALLWWIYLDLHLKNDLAFAHMPRFPKLAYGIAVGLVLVIAQIALGGWVSSHYAGLACIDLPYCNGQWLPAMQWDRLNQDLITIHMLHRIGAVITALYLAVLTIILLTRPYFRLMGTAILGLLLLQLALGILNILWLRPVFIALAHQAVGILLLLTLITAIIKAGWHGPAHD